MLLASSKILLLGSIHRVSIQSLNRIVTRTHRARCDCPSLILNAMRRSKAYL